MVARAKNPVHSVLFPIPVFRDTSGFRIFKSFLALPVIRKLPFHIQQKIFIFFFLLLLTSFYRLMMEDLTKVIEPLYDSGWSAGGMNGGVNPPPAPENANLLLTPPSQHEAGPSNTNSHLFDEDQQRLERMRQDNKMRLQENAKLLEQYEAGIRDLEETLNNMKKKDAERDLATSIKMKDLDDEYLMNFVRTELPKIFEWIKNDK